MGIGILTMVVVPWACQKTITKIKSKINPTSVLPKMVVQHITDIQPGDVLSIPLRFSFHDVIVEKVNLLERMVQLKKVSLDVVHYAFCGLLGTRTVVMEQVDIDLDKEGLLIYNFPIEKSFSKDTTVARAIKKLDEQKFNMFGRRSSHIAWECKVLPRVKAKPTKEPVTSVDKVEQGDVIEFTYCCLPHVGVVVNVKPYVPSDLIELTYIHVNSSKVVSEDTEEIDLETKDVYVQIYNHKDIENNTNVVIKAQQHLDEKFADCIFYKSSRFALSCKLKTQDS